MSEAEWKDEDIKWKDEDVEWKEQEEGEGSNGTTKRFFDFF